MAESTNPAQSNFPWIPGINNSAATAKVNAGTALIANAPGKGNLWMSARYATAPTENRIVRIRGRCSIQLGNLNEDKKKGTPFEVKPSTLAYQL